MKPPKNGCVLLEHIHHRGAMKHRFNDVPGIVEWFSSVTAAIQAKRPTAIYESECPFDMDDPLPDLLMIRPPFPEVWLETFDQDGNHRGFAVVETTTGPDDPEGAEYAIYITAFALPAGPQKKAAGPIGAVRFAFDKNDKNVAVSAPPIYTNKVGEDRNALLNMYAIAPAVVMLQRANITNVGFFQVKDPDENSPRLTRSQQEKVAERRYYVLTIRNKAEMRSRNKIVTRQGVRPAHFARGHYQHYGPAAVHGHPDGRDRGLAFGWLPGRFWIEAVAKGDEKNGRIDKDYKFGKAKPDAIKLPSVLTTFRAATSPTNRDIQVPQPQEHRV